MFLGFAFICELNGIMKWISFSTTFWSKQLSSEILVDLCFKKFKDLVVKSFGSCYNRDKNRVSMSIIIHTLTHRRTHIHTYYMYIYITVIKASHQCVLILVEQWQIAPHLIKTSLVLPEESPLG